MNLWGPHRDLDFWTAQAAGLVPVAELRAMKLLASVCDEERFALYCMRGTLAAMGDATKNLYVIRRYATTVETYDGREIESWCGMTRDRHLIPETDHVFALKLMIEGQELEFRGIANRAMWGSEGGSLVKDPYREAFLPSEIPEDGCAEFDFDYAAVEKEVESLKFRLWLADHAILQKAINRLSDEGLAPDLDVTENLRSELWRLRENLASTANTANVNCFMTNSANPWVITQA